MSKRLLLVLSLVIVLLLLPISVSGSEVKWYKLTAAQHLWVGDINVWDDGDTLYVEYHTNYWDGCLLTETHLAVVQELGGIPQTVRGNPIPGQFPYSRKYDPPVIRDDPPYQILLGDLQEPFIIAAHAVVICEGWEEDETAWGSYCGSQWPFPDAKKWAYYMVYPPR
jgi:hypothetical protein